MKRLFHFILSFIVLLFISSSVLAENPVKDLFEKALVAYSQGDYSQAIELFEKAVQIYPTLAAAYNYIGLSQKALDMSKEEVLASFEKAIEADPSYAPTYDSLSKYYYYLGQFDVAEQYGLKSIELNPQQITSYLTVGWICLIGQGKPQKAIPYFEKALAETDFVYAYFGLGLSYYMDGQNYKVLDMITSLRQKGEEDFALKLESLLKSGTYNPSKDKGFFEMMLKSETHSRNSANDKNEVPPISPPSPTAESGAQRILELQKRGANFSDKDLYY